MTGARPFVLMVEDDNGHRRVWARYKREANAMGRARLLAPNYGPECVWVTGPAGLKYPPRATPAG